MDFSELETMLTEGLAAEDAAAVKAALAREPVKAKAAFLRTWKDMEAREAKIAELEKTLDGVDAQGNPVGYRSWYNASWANIEKQNKDVTDFRAKFGDTALARLLEGKLSVVDPAKAQATGGLTEEDVRRIAAEVTMQQYGANVSPRLANGFKGGLDTFHEHYLVNKRQTKLDMDALANLANQKYNGDIHLAYEEWDRPERQRLEVEARKQAEVDREKEIEKRVREELAKRNVPSMFPTGADLTPSSLTARPDSEKSSFDRSALNRDLMTAFVNAGETRAA